MVFRLLCIMMLGTGLLAEERLRVVTTTGMIGDVVAQIGGERVDVTWLIGADVDPHLYRPTRQDMIRLRQADLVFYNGMMLEGRMGEVLERLGRGGKPVVAVTRELQERETYVLFDEDERLDPHVWMDVAAWMEVAAVITETLTDLLPDHADELSARSEVYREKLKELDRYARETLGEIPEQRRVLVTAHDAFAYMGRAYGLEVRGIQGISTESEAGIRDIENLVRFLVERDIPAVFVESSVSDRNVLAIVEGAAARGNSVRIGGELFSDAMGPAGTREGTYIGMMEHNVRTIAGALSETED